MRSRCSLKLSGPGLSGLKDLQDVYSWILSTFAPKAESFFSKFS
jgi:hypothetical protein